MVPIVNRGIHDWAWGAGKVGQQNDFLAGFRECDGLELLLHRTDEQVFLFLERWSSDTDGWLSRTSGLGVASENFVSSLFVTEGSERAKDWSSSCCVV